MCNFCMIDIVHMSASICLSDAAVSKIVILPLPHPTCANGNKLDPIGTSCMLSLHILPENIEL